MHVFLLYINKIICKVFAKTRALWTFLLEFDILEITQNALHIIVVQVELLYFNIWVFFYNKYTAI